MHLIHQRRVSSHIQEPTVNGLTLPDWEPKQKVSHVGIREMLFADDAALVTHTMEDLQQLIDKLSHACKEFGLTITIKKTKVMGQCIVSPPSININNVTLDAVDSFTYLGSTIYSNLPLDAEINIRTAKAAAVMSKLNRRVWQNNNLTQMTKLCIYQACVLSTLLYCSEAWTTYTHGKRRN